MFLNTEKETISKNVGFILVQVFRAKLHYQFILKSMQLFEGNTPVRFANWRVFAH